ncbi:glycoside hydrolase family 3 protein [Actinokineospora bangkokensis]|uniref:glycoside hydrolase family 3 protein n=1 Tax=Actinokineospora bangkokensis TaxID=1193682 RepID=UPI000B182E04|nr:glycoside hydrolase family 3 protein [Actinokineospora bangkokensis]
MNKFQLTQEAVVPVHRSVRRALTASAATLTAAALAAPTSSAAAPEPPTQVTDAEQTAQVSWTEAVLRRMTLEQKVGQLFVATVWGKSADEVNATNRAHYGVDTAAEVVRRYQVGGVIYFNNSGTDNVDNPRQLAAFSNGLQRAALTSAPHLPLVVSIDQEGGNVTRVEAPATEFPSSMAVGAGRSTADARTLAAVNGHELRAMGINQDFAPVADVNSNPQNPVIGARSFGARPDLASALVGAEVRGYQASGKPTETVSSAAKHFPGHGDAATDSHTGLPVINRTAEQWRAVDLPPFRAAVDAGIDVIMTAHIQFPSLDPSGVPATLSKPIITDLLRGELGYRGVVVTDSLGMQGVREMFGDAEIPVRALEAGVDQLLMPVDLGLAQRSVLDAVRSGRLTEQRIDESVRRVLALKWKRGILAKPFVDERAVDRRVGIPTNKAAIQRLTDKTTTVLRNDAGLLPLRAKPQKVLVAGIGDTVTPANSPANLAASIAARGVQATPLATGLKPNATTIAGAVSAAQSHDAVVVLTNNLAGNPDQRALLTALLGTGKPVIAVAAQVPYDAGFVDAPTWVATYSWRAVSLESLTKVLFGEVSPRGKLPVDVPDGANPSVVRYAFDHGLTW